MIGIYNKSSIYYNKGIFLKDIISKFIKEYEKYKFIYNEINILINVDNYKENEKIYFLDNYGYKDKNNYHIHDNLKQLNSSNTELFINKIKYEYKKYFIPEKNGEYSIKLKFKINLTDSSFMFAGCDNIKSIFFL